MMISKIVLYSPLILLLLIYPNFGLQYSSYQRLQEISKCRCGSKRSPSFGKMVKAFWLSLVDPENVDSLVNEDKRDKSSDSIGKKRRKGFFGSTIPKGRSLK
jgi:hypothetical protein